MRVVGVGRVAGMGWDSGVIRVPGLGHSGRRGLRRRLGAGDSEGLEGDPTFDQVGLPAGHLREHDRGTPRAEAEVRRGDAVGVLLDSEDVERPRLVERVVAVGGEPPLIVEADLSSRIGVRKSGTLAR